MTARVQEVKRPHTNTARNVRGPAPAAFISASVLPISATHRRANRTGEYQSTPSTKITTPVTSTATKFTCIPHLRAGLLSHWGPLCIPPLARAAGHPIDSRDVSHPVRPRPPRPPARAEPAPGGAAQRRPRGGLAAPRDRRDEQYGRAACGQGEGSRGGTREGGAADRHAS